jgi:hypothetical protein
VLRAHFSLPAGAVPVFDVLLQAAARADGVPAKASGHDVASDVGRLVIAQPRGLPAWSLSAAVVSAARLRLVLDGLPSPNANQHRGVHRAGAGVADFGR